MSPADSTFEPANFVREAYAIAERMDLQRRKSLFADDGIFIDESVQRTNKGPDELDYPVRPYGTGKSRSSTASRRVQ
jgi:hypothetical protein